MKKYYIIPAVEVADLEAEKMISLSIQNGDANSENGVLSRDNDDSTDESPYQW